MMDGAHPAPADRIFQVFTVDKDAVRGSRLKRTAIAARTSVHSEASPVSSKATALPMVEWA